MSGDGSRPAGRAGGDGRSAVLPRYGPTLPALVRRRFGVPQRVTLVAALVAVAVLGGAALAARGADGRTLLTHAEAPAFTLLYRAEDLRERPSRRGELARLEARRGPFVVSVVVRPLLEGRRVALSSLPIEAGRRVARMRRDVPGFVLEAEGKGRANDAPGYQFEFLAPRVHGRELLVVPDDEAPAQGVTVRLRRSRLGRPMNGREQRLFGAATRAYRSFRFGTDRP